MEASSLVQQLQLAEDWGIHAYVMTASGKVYCESLEAEVTRSIAAAHNLSEKLFGVGPLSKFDFADDCEVLRVHFEAASSDRHRLSALQEALVATGSKCSFLRVDASAIDAYPAGVSKAAALDIVRSKFDISVAESMAFGDAENDISMLRDAGVGVAMANAADATKSVADIIIGHHDTDAIADFLLRCQIDPERGAIVLCAAESDIARDAD